MDNNFNNQNQWQGQQNGQGQWQGHHQGMQNQQYNQQYNNGQQIGNPNNWGGVATSPKKSKAWIIILVIIILIGALIGVVAISNGKKDKTMHSENTKIENELNNKPGKNNVEVVKPTETPETIVEPTVEPTPEATVEPTEAPQLDEIVNGKIPTPEEFEQVLESLDFGGTRSNDDSAYSTTLDIEYKIFDNEMSAMITYEAMKDTVKDAVVAQHVSDGKHYAYEVIQDEVIDNYTIIRVRGTLHNKSCEVLDSDLTWEERIIEVYILKNNTILTYKYETNDANETNSTVKTFEKALEIMEYVTIEKDEIIEAETVETSETDVNTEAETVSTTETN